MSVRIAVDLRPFLTSFVSGVTVYAKGMIEALQKQPDVELDLFYQSRKPCKRIHKAFPGVRHIPVSTTWYYLKSALRFGALPKDFFEQKPDLIWFPDRRPFYKTTIPLVMTIHDGVPEAYASTYPFKGRLWHKLFSLERLVSLCDGILTPSYFTAKAVVPAGMPYRVTYEGASLAKKMQMPKKAKSIAGEAFFLAISPADPRKRLDWILNAAEQLPDLNFVIAGIKKNDKRFVRMDLSERKNLFLLPEITEEEKLWLLRHAKALLALSEYEGFDLPVLEAVEAKCPVVMSAIEVHKELYKASPMMVDRFEKLLKVLKGGAFNIPEPKYTFTWDRAAHEALLLFGDVIAHKNR